MRIPINKLGSNNNMAPKKMLPPPTTEGNIGAPESLFEKALSVVTNPGMMNKTPNACTMRVGAMSE
jgi:hypothetical protein